MTSGTVTAPGTAPAKPQPRPPQRPRAGRAQPRLQAGGAGPDRDGRGDRVSAHQHDRPVTAARRPALPRCEQVHRPRQLRGGAACARLVAGRVAHRDHHRRQRLDPVRAGHAARARDAPHDLRPWHAARDRAGAVRDRRGRRRLLVELRLVADERLDPTAARPLERSAQPPVRQLRRDHHHRGLEEHAVHGAAVAGRALRSSPTSCWRRPRSTAPAPGSDSSGSRCR